MTMELDTYSSRITRQVGTLQLRRTWHFVQPLRRFYAERYRQNENRWTLIEDLDQDLKFRVDRSSYLASQIYWVGYHSQDERMLLDKLLKPHMVFVDVGANRGELTLYAAKRLSAGKVLAFEPIGSIYRRLLENIQLNHFKNVAAYNFGLSDKPADVEFYTPDPSTDQRTLRSEVDAYGTMFQSSSRSHSTGIARVEVFDKVFENTELNRLDVMKIDVEGAELSVLRGA